MDNSLKFFLNSNFKYCVSKIFSIQTKLSTQIEKNNNNNKIAYTLAVEVFTE